MRAVQRALLSVSDKDGLVDFARALAGRGVALLSTGGTARRLRQAGLEVTEVSDYTGFPEIMDGRVKTLHPRVHGGLLGRLPADEAVMAEHGIEPIDLLVVNLYPFEATIARADVHDAEAIEQIDIGGPAMLRAAAKNHARLTVVVDPGDYARVLDSLESNGGGVDARLRRELAAKTYAHTSDYDRTIAAYLGVAPRGAEGRPTLPPVLDLRLRRTTELRYGENPHQRAALYVEAGAGGEDDAGGIATAQVLQGKPLSFNNLLDADTALECVRGLERPACVIVKHANPCGVAVAPDLLAAYDRAYATDPTSAFGGIIACNRELDEAAAAAMIERQFIEVLVAPAISTAAARVLADKPNVRVLMADVGRTARPSLDYRRIVGGMLVQDRDLGRVTASALRTVSRRSPDAAELDDLLFAWHVVKFVKSNAIVYARDAATLAIGAGQMSRVVSARIAALKAADEGLSLEGAVMASDAFFPFRDGIDGAAAQGIRAVIQPGGSVRDAELIAAADEHGMAMVFTGMRHFRH